MKFLNIKGQKFGRYSVIRFKGRIKGASIWECRCDCGNIRYVRQGGLADGRQKSCGCYRDELASKSSTIHGQYLSKTYKSWSSMRMRCNNKKSSQYPRYGGRGIKVCKRWNSFVNFYKDMGDRPILKTLDRIDFDGNYSPKNCRWATMKEQQNNRSTNVIIEHDGKIMNITQWSNFLKIPFTVIAYRVRKGWPIKDCLESPIMKRIPLHKRISLDPELKARLATSLMPRTTSC